MGSSLFGFDHFGTASTPDKEEKDKDKKEQERTPTEENRKLPIINPIVKLPNWPSTYNFIIFRNANLLTITFFPKILLEVPVLFPNV